jgi:hypothetical protein
MVTEATIVFAAAIIFVGLAMVAKEIHLLGTLFWHHFSSEELNQEERKDEA